MKLFVGFLILFLGLCISAVAGIFSIVGIMSIFSATAISVGIMMGTLEAGKLAAAAWLHSNWTNKNVNKLHKGYMVSAVIVLMMITALGIYGYLAKGHLEQQSPIAPVELQIANKQSQIDRIQIDEKGQTTRLAQMDAAVNSMITGDKAAQGLKYRYSQAKERKQIQDTITADDTKIEALTAEIVPLKLQINSVETKLGPIKYIAQLFGFKDTEVAVRIVIVMLMFAFDPLAIMLVLSSTITIDESLKKVSKKEIVIEIEPEPEPELETIEPEPAIMEQPPLTKSDKEMLLEILERAPELLQQVVDAIREKPEEPEDVSPPW